MVIDVAAGPQTDVPTYRHRNVTTRSTRRRHVALVAAVVVALAGAGTLYLARAGDDPVRSTTESTVPPVVIGDVTWPSVLPIVEDAYGSVNAFAADQFRVAQATLARRVDGALVDPVIVEVGTDYAATHNGAESTDIVGVFGQTAHVYTSLDDVVPLAVVVGDDPYVAVAGVDPMSFLNRVGEDFVTPDVPADGGPITMAFGDLPEGYEVIYNDGEPDDVTAFVSTCSTRRAARTRRCSRPSGRG